MRISRRIFITVISVVLALVCIFNLRGFMGEITEKVLTKVGIAFFSEFHQYKDWSYDLPNGYYLSQTHSHAVELISPYGHVLVEPSISFFCYNNSFIGIQRKEIPEDSWREAEEILENPNIPNEYYLIKIDTETVYGPMNKSEYKEACSVFEVGNLGDWITTLTVPEGAYA